MITYSNDLIFCSRYSMNKTNLFLVTDFFMRLYESIIIVHHDTEVGPWRREAEGYLHRFFLN